MSQIDDFGQTRDVAITVLVDNRADLLLKSTARVRRFSREALLAEHGFAVWVELREHGICMLWDAGTGHDTLLENMRRMRLDPRRIDAVALSHGHRDHTGGLTSLLGAVELRPTARRWTKSATMAQMRAYAEGHTLPIVMHPAALRERWWVNRDGSRRGPDKAPTAEWEALGGRIVLSEGPYRLAPGCWTTGYVPRASFERAGVFAALHYRDGDALRRDEVEDDQALVLNIADKGLVVLAGCAHAGIINTIVHAREISGVERVYAVLGGFHLASAKTDEVERTIDEIERLDPALVVPTHCTGFWAMARFAARMPAAFLECGVGTTYLL